MQTPGSPALRRPRFAADIDRRVRRDSWSRSRRRKWVIVPTTAQGLMPKAGREGAAPAHRAAIEWSLRETRRALSGGFFPGLEELVDDPAGGAPDDVVADRVVVDSVLLLTDAPSLGRVDVGIEQSGDWHHEQTLHLVGRQPQVIDAALDQADHGPDHKTADPRED